MYKRQDAERAREQGAPTLYYGSSWQLVQQLVGVARAARDEATPSPEAELRARRRAELDGFDDGDRAPARAGARRGAFELVFCEWCPRRSSTSDRERAQIEPCVTSCKTPDVLARWLASRSSGLLD